MLTMGVCVAPCTMPGVGYPHFTMDDDTICFGIGIHGEAGSASIKVGLQKNIYSYIVICKIVSKLNKLS
jgi:dihydroxyacetone kinase-like protein